MELSNLSMQDLNFWREECSRMITHFRDLGSQYQERLDYWSNAASKIEDEIYKRQKALFGSYK